MWASVSLMGRCVARWLAACEATLPACYTTVARGATAPVTASVIVVLTQISGLHAMAQHKHIIHIDPAATHESQICHMIQSIIRIPVGTDIINYFLLFA